MLEMTELQLLEAVTAERRDVTGDDDHDDDDEADDVTVTSRSRVVDARDRELA